MKKLALILVALGAVALEPTVLAGGRGGGAHKGGGGGGAHKVSKPSGGGAHKVSKPSGGGAHKISKPSGGGGAHKISKPSGGSGNFRPSGGGNKPAISKPNISKPSGGGGGRLPQTKPAQRPQVQRPSGSGGGLPSFSGGGNKPQIPNRPSTLPANRPQVGGGGKPKLPDRKPGGGGGDFIGLKPDRPTTLPGNIPGNRPGGGDRPSTLPGNIAGNRPGGSRPGQGGGGEQWKPGGGDRLPNRPGQGGGGEQWRPGGGGGFNPDHRPGHPDRPARPNRPDNWQNIANKNNNQWNSWRQKNEVNINNFQVNRTNNWNNINARYNQNGWATRYGSGEYHEWRNNVWDFRKDRCEEIWDHRQDFWDDCFDNHWWGSCWWRPRPVVAVSAAVSPWWWWKPFAWAGAGAFFGATVAAQPIVYDPGTTVIYEGDNYYVDGKVAGTATEARKAAIELATPAVAEVPVPDPAPEGQPEEWMPLGVWALTQQEQGDATMFMQFSVNKDGLIGGAYKNVMTGDEQPIVGQVDKKTQRVAWHVGDATQTIYETGLSGLENDVYSVFVHFGEKQTQTWLLVRLPSPEIPPGTVKLPDLAKQ